MVCLGLARSHRSVGADLAAAWAAVAWLVSFGERGNRGAAQSPRSAAGGHYRTGVGGWLCRRALDAGRSRAGSAEFAYLEWPDAARGGRVPGRRLPFNIGGDAG